jgi:hypothetical protein
MSVIFRCAGAAATPADEAVEVAVAAMVAELSMWPLTSTRLPTYFARLSPSRRYVTPLPTVVTGAGVVLPDVPVASVVVGGGGTLEAGGTLDAGGLAADEVVDVVVTGLVVVLEELRGTAFVRMNDAVRIDVAADPAVVVLPLVPVADGTAVSPGCTQPVTVIFPALSLLFASFFA